MEAFNVAVLGGGPGGYTAAIRVAQLGAAVCLVEMDKVGGTCLNRGCIPTKALLTCAEVLAHIKHAEEYGVEVTQIKPSFARMVERKDKIVANLISGVGFLLKSYGVTVLKGRGVLTAKDKVWVEGCNGGGVELQADKIIIATGSRPALIPAFNIDGKKIITSNEALNLKELPESIIIVGGGVIGCEFACIFSELGVKVTILELLPNILPTEDKVIGQRLRLILKKRGVEILNQSQITRIEVQGDKVVASLEGKEPVSADMALISIGRSMNTEDIGLREMGIAQGRRGEILVDDKMETNVHGIYAIGDVVGKIMLAHVAAKQGLIAAANAMGGNASMNYSLVPSCIFTSPEIGSVGLTADKAKEQGFDVTLGNFSFMALGKAQAMGQTEGTVRLVVDVKTDKILGAQIMGPHATDLIAEVTLAIKMGATAHQISETIHAHPTLAEAIFEASEDVHDVAIHAAKKK
ncbi:MAG: dihydrolipoyl dehydrogenase [Candidatus Schekmanbacteria bacterium]|nr:dihydrolipoyl dehydrogenase [Candidatus Schekmanbacteria bacterium]